MERILGWVCIIVFGLMAFFAWKDVFYNDGDLFVTIWGALTMSAFAAGGVYLAFHKNDKA